MVAKLVTGTDPSSDLLIDIVETAVAIVSRHYGLDIDLSIIRAPGMDNVHYLVINDEAEINLSRMPDLEWLVDTLVIASVENSGQPLSVEEAVENMAS